MDLTKRQQEVLHFIQEFIEKNRFSPSVRDIAIHFNMASSAGVHKHLKILERKGYICTTRNISRSIRILDQSSDKHYESMSQTSAVELPLKGKVAAGVPIEYHLDNETMVFPKYMVRHPEKTYALKVYGNSMVGEYIQDGDYVLIEESHIAIDGEMIIAMINYEEATLKKIYYEGKKIRLQPSNPSMKPIYVYPKEITIQGKVVGVLRLY